MKTVSQLFWTDPSLAEDVTHALRAAPCDTPCRIELQCGPRHTLDERSFIALINAATDRLLRSQVFISLCAVAITLQTSLIAAVRPLPFGVYAFLFVSTLASYRIHAHVALRLAGSSDSGERSARCWTALALCTAGGLSFQLTFTQFCVACGAGSVAWLYSVPIRAGARRLRDWGVLKILGLTGTWTLMTAVFPLLESADTSTIVLLAARRFLFIFALCMTFDLRDVDADAQLGIRTLAVRVGQVAAFRIVRLALLMFALLSVVGRAGVPTIHELPQSAALLASTAVSWLVVERTRSYASHFLYLGCVDGMMLLQSLLVCGASVRLG